MIYVIFTLLVVLVVLAIVKISGDWSVEDYKKSIKKRSNKRK